VRLAAAVITLVALGAAVPTSASTAYKPDKYVARYCSTSGDVCFGIFRAGGIVFQLLTVEKYFARYQVCVRAPTGARKCLTSLVRRQGSLYGSHLRWPRRFGHHGNGVYRVTWRQTGVRLGPTLRFRER
jgi:hypothetical protein